jgi:2-C-methyl-D-erythritol 4-phosphate cytidylyltransferase
MRAAAVLLGAGRGDRLAGERPKAFVELGGRTLLAWAVDTVEVCPEVEALVVVVPSGWQDQAEAIVRPSPKLLAVATGGETRQASVRVALDAVPEEFDAVLCHDVARPLASPKLFSEVLRPLEAADGAVPVVPVADTVKRIRDGLVAETVPRQDLVLAQTPQAFLRRALVAAHRRAAAAGRTATDDATLLEWAGYRMATVPGEPANVKITGPHDLAVAQALAHG